MRSHANCQPTVAQRRPVMPCRLVVDETGCCSWPHYYHSASDSVIAHGQSLGKRLVISHTQRYTYMPLTYSQFIAVLHFLVQGTNTVVTPAHSKTRNHCCKLLIALCMIPSKCSKVQGAMQQRDTNYIERSVMRLYTLATFRLRGSRPT